MIRVFTVRYTDYSDSNQAANVQADLSFCCLHMGYGNSWHSSYDTKSQYTHHFMLILKN